MKTIQTTTYEHDSAGQVITQTVIREEVPGGNFLRIDGLTEDQVAHLVAVRDAFHKEAS